MKLTFHSEAVLYSLKQSGHGWDTISRLDMVCSCEEVWEERESGREGERRGRGGGRSKEGGRREREDINVLISFLALSYCTTTLDTLHQAFLCSRDPVQVHTRSVF